MITQLLIETGLLCLSAGVVGASFSYAVLQFAMQFYLPVPMPFALTTRMDLWVLTFALVVSLGITRMCGLAPALQSWKADVTTALKGTTRSHEAVEAKEIGSRLR